MSATALVVVRFSASSQELWSQLAEGLDVEVRGMAPRDLPTLPAAAAVVVAAVGAEREAMAWLDGRDIPSGVPVFLVGADPSRRVATEAMRLGVRDYFALPEDGELLHNALAAAIARHREATSRRVMEDRGDVSTPFRALAGEHPAFASVIQRAAQLAQYRNAVGLILGEEGYGKEMLARAIHEASNRCGAPFVAVNCSALPPHLAAAELFGHEDRSAGPHESSPGLFEVASGGTIYLDEVATLPPDVQVRLLRTLETGEVVRVGATKPRAVDVRVLAGSSEDLDRAIQRGALRRDLNLRLNAVTMAIPPLRERGEDVLLIAQRLINALASLHNIPVPELSPENRRALLEHPWPGNVRELKNALERALLLSPPRQLSMAELFPARTRRVSPPGGLPFPAELDEIAAAAGLAMFDVCSGNLSEAARRLGVSRSRLRRLLRAAPSVLHHDPIATSSYQGGVGT